MNNARRDRRKQKIRVQVKGTSERPRAAVFRSLRNISVQLIDDVAGNTVLMSSGKASEAKNIGKDLAEKALSAGIKTIAFDRGGYRYHGRVKAVAEGMREGGLVF